MLALAFLLLSAPLPGSYQAFCACTAATPTAAPMFPFGGFFLHKARFQAVHTMVVPRGQELGALERLGLCMAGMQ